jgi:hypothetical protein
MEENFDSRLSDIHIIRGWLKMPIDKASDIPKNEAYILVRRNDEG